MWDIMPESASTFAGDIDGMIKLITYIVGAWAAAAYLIFFFFLFAYRRRDGVRSKYVTGSGKQALWVLLPVLAVSAFDFGIDIKNTPIWNHAKLYLPESGQVVRMNAKQWAWEFTYPGPDGQLDTADDVRSLNMLHVKVDEPVKFELVAEDVLHSLSIPVMRVKQDAIPGRKILGWFEPIKTGEWDIQCAEICGIGHTVMAARIKVHSADEFEKAMAILSRDKGSATMQTAALLADPNMFEREITE